MATYALKLYVTGQTPRSERAIANLKLIYENQLQGQYQLVIVDVLEFPGLAEEEKIIATPTLIKELPTLFTCDSYYAAIAQSTSSCSGQLRSRKPSSYKGCLSIRL